MTLRNLDARLRLPGKPATTKKEDFMDRLHQLLDHVLQDKRITRDEVQIINEFISADGKLDLADVRFLVELLVGAKEVCAEFDEMFFPVLKNVFMKDGRIDPSEQFYLLKTLYGDGVIRPVELKFLMELRREAVEVTAEFDELCRIARDAHPTQWSLDGDEADETSLANSGW